MEDSLELFSPKSKLRYPSANLSSSQRRKADLFTVHRSLHNRGLRSGPIRGKPRVDRFQRAHEGSGGEDCHGEICLRDMFARKTQKGTGWERALESPSNPLAYTASNDSRKRENGNTVEGRKERERERDVLASSSGFKLADTPGASRRPL